MTDPTEKLGAHEVATWLRRHPEFLRQFPDLAGSLVVPRETGPAASLASYQLEVLREKNRELNRRIQELFGNAQENERLSVRIHQLTLGLMRQATAMGTLRAMAASLEEDFHGDLVRIVLLRPIDGLEAAPWLDVFAPGDMRFKPFADFLAGDEPLCGRLQPAKHDEIYGERGDEVQSSALFSAHGLAMVAVGSADPNRFYPGMGTLFLRMMGEAFGAALARYVD